MEPTLDTNQVKNMKIKWFSDTLVPRAGNLKAYQDFESRPNQGIHIRVSGNDFQKIHGDFGHKVHSEAVGVLGDTIHSALRDNVPKGKYKLFRVRNDEFHAFVPTMEHAAQVLRAARGTIENIPPIFGMHQLSASFGLGNDPQNAHRAMYSAKHKRTEDAPNPVHSLVKEHEGAF